MYTSLFDGRCYASSEVHALDNAPQTRSYALPDWDSALAKVRKSRPFFISTDIPINDYSFFNVHINRKVNEFRTISSNTLGWLYVFPAMPMHTSSWKNSPILVLSQPFRVVLVSRSSPEPAAF